MKINQTNIEAYLLDYMEGRLEMHEVEELMAYAKANGLDLDELTEDLPVLKPEPAVFESKNNLMQPEIIPVGEMDENNYDDYFIAYQEGLLNATETQQVESFLEQNPSLKKDFTLYQMSQLKADETVTFPNKEKLRKRNVIRPLWISAASVAAAIALLFGLFRLPFGGQDIQTLQPMAELTPIQPTAIETEQNSEPILAERAPVTYPIPQPATRKTESATPKRDMELIAVLPSLPSSQVQFSEDYAIEVGSMPDWPPYRYSEDLPAYTQLWDDMEEELPNDLLGRAIYRFSEGRFSRIGQLIDFGVNYASKEVSRFAEETAEEIAFRTDSRIEEAKERWQELTEKERK